MNEKERILKMIEEGKITALEGLELLNALEELKATSDNSQTSSTTEKTYPKRKFTVLKVRVLIDEEDINVNVNIPLSIFKVFGNITDELDKLIPQEAKDAMKDNGIDLSGMDFAKIIESIENGVREDPNIVDINISEKSCGSVRIKIYLD